MKLSSIAVLAFAWSGAAQKVCTSDLLIEDFANRNGVGRNNIGGVTGNDGTLVNLVTDSVNSKISFNTTGASYLYINMNTCQAAITSGYNAIRFTIKGPPNGWFTMYLKAASASCADVSRTSLSSRVTFTKSSGTGTTGSRQTYTVPLSTFTGVKLDAIMSIMFDTFYSQGGGWEVGKFEYVCAGIAPKTSSTTKISSTLLPSTSVARGISSSATSVIKSSTVVQSSNSVPSSSKVLSSSPASFTTQQSSTTAQESNIKTSSSAELSSVSIVNTMPSPQMTMTSSTTWASRIVDSSSRIQSNSVVWSTSATSSYTSTSTVTVVGPTITATGSTVTVSLPAVTIAVTTSLSCVGVPVTVTVYSLSSTLMAAPSPR